MVVAIDTETAGKDLYHGVKPFFVTVCEEDGTQKFWEWEVDPLTRQPQIPPGDVDEIASIIATARNWGRGWESKTAARHGLVLHNAKFDVTALATLDPVLGTDWPWTQTHDTLTAGHLLASNQPHDLTSMALHYLGEDNQTKEKALEEAVKEARRHVQQARLRAKRHSDKEVDPLARWLIAEEGLPGLPSAKGEAWRNDYWLPRTIVKHWWETSEAFKAWKIEIDCEGSYQPRQARGRSGDDFDGRAAHELPGWEYRPTEVEDGDHSWWTVLSTYANTDSETTLALWLMLEQEIRRRGLWNIYEERRKANSIAYRMEAGGLTLSRVRLNELRDEYEEESERCGKLCVNLAASCNPPYELELPKNGVNSSLRRFCFDVLDLPRIHAPKAKTIAPTLNKAAFEHYETVLPAASKSLTFIRALKAKRKRDTAVTYLDGYERFWLPDKEAQLRMAVSGMEAKHKAGNRGSCATWIVPGEWYVLHPNLNPTGTDTLRWSSSNPNEQNISKQEEECHYCRGEGCDTCNHTGHSFRSLRYVFGPAPEREWWSMDAKNIELRLPAYESGEEDLIALFERPDDPPYYGSEHLLNFSAVYPDVWAEELRAVGLEKVGPHCKKKYKTTYYQWCKNGGFAVGYGAVDRADGGGTADRAFHRPGSHARLKARFDKKEKLNQYWIRFAEKHGYIETIPDKTVDPSRGYPLLCTRTEWGRILPTVPLNYHIQSSAMWWMLKAMIRCQTQLDAWKASTGFDGRITLQVHDELVFDFPKLGDPLKEQERQDISRSNSAPTFRTSNLWRVRVLQRLMEEGGSKDYGIPTPVGIEYHRDNWEDGETLPCQ